MTQSSNTEKFIARYYEDETGETYYGYGSTEGNAKQDLMRMLALSGPPVDERQIIVTVGYVAFTKKDADGENWFCYGFGSTPERAIKNAAEEIGAPSSNEEDYVACPATEAVRSYEAGTRWYRDIIVSDQEMEDMMDSYRLPPPQTHPTCLLYTSPSPRDS